MESLKRFRDKLLELGLPLYHFVASDDEDQYLLWAEEGPGAQGFYDNQCKRQTFAGTLDYFTKTEFDPNFDVIQEKLNSMCIAWTLNSIDYDEVSKVYHFEWTWEV